jgi:hypothetical protein
VFSETSTYLEDEESVIVKVDFTVRSTANVQTDENVQTAASATMHGIEYIIHYSGTELIVYRRVPCPRPSGYSERYYIESSDRIPVDSTDTPLGLS